MMHLRTGSLGYAMVVVLMTAAFVSTVVLAFAARGEAEQPGNADGGDTRFGDEERTAQARSDASSELIVVMEQDATGGRAGDVLKRSLDQKDGEIVEGPKDRIKTARFPALRGKSAELENRAAEVSDLPGVKYAEPNGFSTFAYKSNDPFVQNPSGNSNQGNFGLVNIFDAWDVSRGEGVAVGVIDSGINKYHRDITPSKVIAEKDVANRDEVANDTTGHGTSVTSVAAAATDNCFGMAGAGFDAKIAACRASEGSANGISFANEARCINWLQKISQVKVINISSGSDGGYSKTVADEISETQSRYGKAVVSIAGNYPGTSSSRHTTKMFPAKLPGVIGVGSNDSATQRSGYSITGPHVDLMAPGSVVAAYGDSQFGVVSGTSYSAPTVSGCVALMYAKGLKLGGIRQRLFETAHNMGPRGYDTATGHGYMDCGRAIRG